MTPVLPDKSDERYWFHVRVRAERLNSDGCTMVTQLFKVCCLEHDIHYRTGQTVYGDPITRKQADDRLWDCICDRSKFGHWSPIAWLRWAGVRVLGGLSWKGQTRRG